MTYQEKYPGQAKYAAKKRANGECNRCKNPRVLGMTMCQSCRESRTIGERLRRQTSRNEQKCTVCSGPRPADRSRCLNCSSRSAAKAAGHGATLEDRQRLFAKQNGKCAICEKKLADCIGRFIHVDHDHATSRVRGLLCGNCNTGIGNLRDSVSLLEKAISYLKGNA